MKLYFLRHAEAEDGPVDAERRLTAKGRRDARRVGRFLEKSGIRLDAAFTSPLVRARETADEVLKHCRSPRKRRAVVVEALVNGTT
ncbi:MAG: histidine phosphatase family protein, partial [Verrucomicrobiales bacterium]|nr:histidine phosphatase family protein [Verrucomicrobiales bacterium]